ncbi:MAG: hypothetical protein K2V38_28320 [Gemmataceae bacterium]|nr:hypothetical protein [Gemmataceae bacterium]
MVAVERAELQVVVPVGFLLSEPQEVTVSVDRPGADPLPVRLRLVPARAPESAAPVSAPTPLAIGWPRRATRPAPDANYTEYGGGD